MFKEGSGFHRFGRLAGTLAATGVLLAGGSAIASAQSRHSAGPKVRGSYTYQLQTPPDCLDPQKTSSSSSTAVDAYVLDPLLSTNGKGQFIGNLAQSYKVSRGGKVLIFKLRHGVKFSNGDLFTAAAVKFTFDRALNPATQSPVTASELTGVTTIVLGKYTIELRLKTPNRVLLSNLAEPFTSILDPKATKAGNTCNFPVGTGVYKIKSDGVALGNISLVTNKYRSFGPSWVHNHGKPFIPKVRLVTITNEDTAISELLTGDVSIAPVPGNQLPRVKGNKKIVLHKLPAQNLLFLNFNLKHKPFNNVAVRRAVAEVINRKDIVKAALGGLGIPVSNIIPPAYKPYYDKAATKYVPSFNISAAAKVFKQYHVQGPYQLLILGVAPFSTFAEILQAELGQAGMKINIESVGDVGTFLSKANSGDFDMSTLSYSFPDPDILTYLLHTKSQSAGSLNWTGYNNSTVNKLLAQEETTLSVKKATQAFDKIQTIVNKSASFIGIAADTSLLGVRSNIKGYHTNSVGAYAFQDVYIS